MENSIDNIVYFWFCLGALLMFGEIILPGLVSVFVGLGAITVAGLVHFGYIESVTMQLSIWFASSIVYIFSLRLLIMKYYPSDTLVNNIDDDHPLTGQIITLSEMIPQNGTSRATFGETSWTIKSKNGEPIPAGAQVKLITRKNILWTVEQVNSEETN